MAFVLVAPNALETAVADVAQLGSALTASNLAAVIPTTALTAAAGDEVSSAIAALFGAHAQEYQTAAAQAAAYEQRFAAGLSAAAASYAGAEVSVAASLQDALESVNVAANWFQTLVYVPIRNAGEAWIASSIGQTLDPILNAPTDALFGRA